MEKKIKQWKIGCEWQAIKMVERALTFKSRMSAVVVMVVEMVVKMSKKENQT